MARLMSLLIVLIPALVLASPAGLKPELGRPVCLKREYTEDHLREFPKQKLSSIYVYLTKNKVRSGGETFEFSGAEVYGKKDGDLYVNAEATCEHRPDGTAFCFIECDGGSFNLTPRKSDTVFNVTKGYYFPLYKSGTDRESATADQTISLEGNDRHNRASRVYSAPVRECQAVKKLVKIKSGGC